MNSLASQIIVDIIAARMGLNDQSVWVQNQNKKIPQTPGIFVIVGQVGWKPYGVNVEEVPVTVTRPSPLEPLYTLKEVITVSAQQMMQIDIMSRDNSALERQWEILAALASTYSVQKQEENCFQIAKLPSSFMDTSSAEGSAILNRFTITINCFVWYKKEQILSQGDIYTEFETRVDDAKTIGTDTPLIRFTIDENTPDPGE